MKLVMTLCVRNECEILRENIEFHLDSGVDFIIATDNRSDDGTRSLLKAYEQQGLLQYLYAPSPFFDQADFQTKMARIAVNKYGADWVINNDADEFWWTPDCDLKAAIKNHCYYQESDALIVNRTDFVSDQKTESSVFYEHMTRRRKVSTNSLGAKLPPKIVHRGDPSIVVGAGNHDVRGKRINSKRLAKQNNIEIFHFPMRSYRHLERKATEDYAAHEKNIVLRSVATTYLEYNRLYCEKNLKAYYDGYCGATDRDKNQVIEDHRFRMHMTSLMKAPVVDHLTQNSFHLNVIQKLHRTMLNKAVCLASTVQFKCYRVISRLRILRLRRTN